MIRTPLSAVEKSIAAKVATANFPPGTASKRFARNLGNGYVKDLSDKGRKFLAFVANRYRRQYPLSKDEWAWINEWLAWEAPKEPVETYAEKLEAVVEEEIKQGKLWEMP